MAMIMIGYRKQQWHILIINKVATYLYLANIDVLIKNCIFSKEVDISDHDVVKLGESCPQWNSLGHFADLLLWLF